MGLSLLIVFLASSLAGFCWGRYINAVRDRRPGPAAVWDGALAIPAVLAKQLWAGHDDNILILLAFVLGSMVGTYLVVRWQ